MRHNNTPPRWLRPITLALWCMALGSAVIAPAHSAGDTHSSASATVSQPASQEALWEKLRDGGYVLLLRHAPTSALSGDPPSPQDPCIGTGALSAAGQEQARRIGIRLNAQDVAVAEVRSSRWCRCIQTARLAFGDTLGEPQVWAPITSFYDAPDKEADNIRAVQDLAATVQAPRNVVLVTHQANINGYTGGINPSQGDMVIVRYRDGRLEVVGRIAAPE